MCLQAEQNKKNELLQNKELQGIEKAIMIQEIQKAKQREREQAEEGEKEAK